MRTQPEIDAQIKWLKENRDKVRSHDRFGGDNRAKIDADIAVLEGKLDADDVYDLVYRTREWTEEKGESANGTVDWLEGNEDMSPKESWEPLVEA